MGTSRHFRHEDVVVVIAVFTAMYLYLVGEAYRDAFFILGLIVITQLGYIFDMLYRMHREGR